MLYSPHHNIRVYISPQIGLSNYRKVVSCSLRAALLYVLYSPIVLYYSLSSIFRIDWSSFSISFSLPSYFFYICFSFVLFPLFLPLFLLQKDLLPSISVSFSFFLFWKHFFTFSLQFNIYIIRFCYQRLSFLLRQCLCILVYLHYLFWSSLCSSTVFPLVYIYIYFSDTIL